MVPQRILVTGPTGSGKTTMARQLSERLHLPHGELDALYWGPDWTMQADFLEQVDSRIAQDQWIVEGGYVNATRNAWPKADLVVWLDYPFPVVLWQLAARILRRRIRDERMFNGNRESLRRHAFSRDSLILWLFQTYGKRRALALELGRDHPHVPLTRLHSRKESEVWLTNFH